MPAVESIVAYLILFVIRDSRRFLDLLFSTLLPVYGRELLLHLPTIVTELCIRLCTGDYTELPVLFTQCVEKAKEKIKRGNSLQSASNSSDASAQAWWTLETFQLPAELKSVNLKAEGKMPVELAVSLYCADDHDNHLLRLLEGVYGLPPALGASSEGSAPLKSAIAHLPASMANTLLELYLHKYSVVRKALLHHHYHGSVNSPVHEGAGKQCPWTWHNLRALRDAIQNLLDNPNAEYDSSHALLLTRIYGYKFGEYLLLYREHGAHQLLLRVYMEQGATNGDASVSRIFKLLNLEGSTDPELYVQALRFFLRRAGAGDDTWTEVTESLANRRRDASDDETAQEDEVVSAGESSEDSASSLDEEEFDDYYEMLPDEDDEFAAHAAESKKPKKKSVGGR